MKTISSSKAQSNLRKLVAETTKSHEPIQITGRTSNAILVSEEDWNAMQETVYLLSVPGMRESIREGLATPLKETSSEPGW